MSGKRIDDHSFWGGKAEAGCVAPKGAKVMTMNEGQGAGDLGKYEDTAKAIKSQQETATAKMKRFKAKDGYRY